MIFDFSKNNFHIVFETDADGMVILKHFSSSPLLNSEKTGSAIGDVHVCGSIPDDRFGAKHMGESGTVLLKYVSHRAYENEFGQKVEFTLGDGVIEVIAHYQFFQNASVVRSWKTVTNCSYEEVGIESVPSFSYTGIQEDGLKLFIPHNSWCSEVDWEEFTPKQLGLKRNGVNSSKRIVYSNTGTWSSKEFLPMAAAVSDDDALLWQIESSGSWLWEIGGQNNLLYLKLSGPNEQEHSWYKKLKPGESFESVKACVAIGKNFDTALEEMTRYRRLIVSSNKENEYLPVIFNDYMNCLWADPTEEKMLPLIDKVAELGCEYYCMDAGWYADGTWWETVGEWKEERKRFPNGIKKVFDYIKSKGLKPGIWLEIEVMGINCPILDAFDDTCFFMRHGKRVVNCGRYQLDFSSDQVRRFATEVVQRVVEEYGAEYIKFDYNIDAGVGTEYNADSFGDGLLKHNRAYLDWIRHIKAKYPHLIIENCSSGGLRMDYAMLAEHHLQSVSDQTEYDNNARIAAAAPIAVLPEQAGIWSYPVSNDSADAVAVNMVNACLQRLYLSGQILQLDETGLQLVKEGIALFKSIRQDISKSIPFYPLGIPKHTDEVFCVGFKTEEKCRLALWCFCDKPKAVHIPNACRHAKVLYPSNTRIAFEENENGITANVPADCTAVIFEL